MQQVKENIKTLLDGDPMDLELHIQSRNGLTFFLGNENGFSSLRAAPRNVPLSK